MTTTVAPIDDLAPEQSFVFDEADWDFYELILAKVGGRRVFVTFDGERLEVMSPSFRHDVSAERLAVLLRLALSHTRTPFLGAGSFTLKKRKTQRGLEPDRCFYIQRVDAVRGKQEIDLRSDPPPDLAIEVEVSRRLLDRIDIYRRLGVPEVWCYDGRRLRILVLGKDRHEERSRSLALPDLPPEGVHELVQRSWGMDDMAWTELVGQWLAQNLPRR